MKIVCDSCSTKYSISDDKVRGKVFKIRCKKCSHIIVVRGNGEGAPASVEAPSDAVWHLVVDGDQVGPLAEAEVRARFSRGEISAENYVWKEGFSDWLRLVDVPEFADIAPPAALAPVGGDLFADSTPAPSGARPSGRHAAVAEQEPFFAAGSTASAPETGGGAARASSGRVRAPAEVVAAAVAAIPDEEDAFSIPAAVPRAGDAADLFGAAPLAARADSGRTKTRGSNGAGSGRHDGGRVENLTAQRSENSVLFSLSNLQSLAAPAATTRQSSSSGSPATEGSGLIDIRAMAASTLRGPSLSAGPLSFGGDGGRSAADDLPTFGAFSSAAPVLFPLPSSSGPPKWIYALIAIAAVLVIAVLVAAVGILRKPMIVEQVAAPVPVAAAPVPPAPPAARTLAENELPPREGKGSESSAGDKGSEKTGGDKGAHGVVRHALKGVGKKGSSGAGDSKGSGDSGSSASGEKTTAEPDKPKAAKGSLDDLLEGALSPKGRSRANQDESGGNSKRGGGSDSSGGGAGGPLAKGAVVAGMNGVKGKVAACYTQFKVPGMAMVNVVISKSGKVASASVTGKFAGTPTGTCVENAVRSASFPASDGLTTPYPFNLR